MAIDEAKYGGRFRAGGWAVFLGSYRHPRRIDRVTPLRVYFEDGYPSFQDKADVAAVVEEKATAKRVHERVEQERRKHAKDRGKIDAWYRDQIRPISEERDERRLDLQARFDRDIRAIVEEEVEE